MATSPLVGSGSRSRSRRCWVAEQAAGSKAGRGRRRTVQSPQATCSKGQTTSSCFDHLIPGRGNLTPNSCATKGGDITTYGARVALFGTCEYPSRVRWSCWYPTPTTVLSAPVR
jgi:hypothetical protein